ncbi:MBL fold metallo-hydrolase [Pyruvatibacter mobilis]|uniref:MBL fold metallo-hydrolase n=1 Tax=Pyruvatibacter mobilis TaxID=1712261 RepID=UPI003BB1AB2F
MSDTLSPSEPRAQIPDNLSEISYPYGLKKAPELGQTIEMAPGIHWLRMPLPYMLDHINLYLIEDGDGWVIVDTGVNTSKVRDLWETVFEGVMGGRPVTKVIVTHLHPDHVGLAGWLTRRFGVELWMSRTDYLMCRNLVLDTGTEAPEEGIRFYREAGFNDAQIERYRKRFGGFGKDVSAIPQSFRRLVGGQEMKIGGRTWRAIVGSGHAPEHICMYCPEAGVLLSGDQVLPRISSNISVQPTEPQADPLTDWLESCARIRDELPADTLVGPAHNEPFYGVKVRLQALIDEHEEDLGKLETMLAEPKKPNEVFSALFRRPITDDLVHMATGESLAHLNCLITRGRARRFMGEDGVARYVQSSREDAAA